MSSGTQDHGRAIPPGREPSRPRVDEPNWSLARCPETLRDGTINPTPAIRRPGRNPAAAFGAHEAHLIRSMPSIRRGDLPRRAVKLLRDNPLSSFTAREAAGALTCWPSSAMNALLSLAATGQARVVSEHPLRFEAKSARVPADPAASRTAEPAQDIPWDRTPRPAGQETPGTHPKKVGGHDRYQRQPPASPRPGPADQPTSGRPGNHEY